MPIDWDDLAVAFRVPMRLQFSALTRAFERLELWLKHRTPYFEQLERTSRGIPTLSFRGDAVSMVIGRHQYGALVPEVGFFASLEVGGRDFVGGVGYVRTAIVEATLLPDLLDTLARALEAVVASVERFAKPTPSMFDARARTASDLFGLAALGFRATVGGLPQLLQAARSVKALRDSFGSAGSHGSPDATSTSAARAVSASIGERLDGFARLSIGGVLSLQVLPELIGLVLRGVDLRIREQVLSSFDGIEKGLFELRAATLEVFWGDLPALATWALGVAKIVNRIVVTNFDYLFDFGTLYLFVLTSFVVEFSLQLERFMNFWQGSANVLLAVVEEILSTDLTPWLVTLFGGVLGQALNWTGVLPALTIGDLIGVGVTAARVLLRTALLQAIRTAHGTLDPPLIGRLGPLKRARRVLNLADDLVEALLQAPSAMPAETAALGPLARFPDVGATLDSALDRLHVLVKQSQATLATDIARIFGAAGDAVGLIADTLQKSQARLARLGSPSRHQAMADEATQLARRAFGADEKLLARAGATDPVAAEFVRWLGGGGFELLTTIIPSYVAALDRYWAEQKTRHDEPSAFLPTSPHILAKREVRLARVQMGTLRLEAAGALDAELAGVIAERFELEAKAAFAHGNDALRGLHERELHEKELHDHERKQAEAVKASRLAPGRTRAVGGTR